MAPKAGSLGRCEDGHTNVAVFAESATCGWGKVGGKWVPPSKIRKRKAAPEVVCGKPLVEWALKGVPE